jgi:Leucine-rich repeat (LRR) protein
MNMEKFISSCLEWLWKFISSCLEWLRSAGNVPEEGSADEHHQTEIAESSKRRPTKFDIFINHRGPDGKPFASHLEDAFKAKGFDPFFDQNGLVRGEHVPEAIKAAIQDACVHLALFTPLYAESPHCLDELADMVECVKKDPHDTVKLIPIFLKVTPSSLRCVERGPFKKAFQHHKQRGRGLRIPAWKAALHSAADMMGFESDKFKNESELKRAIIDRVEKIIDSVRVDRTQSVPTYNVGREQLLRFALSKLEPMGDNVSVLGIWGAGGIGKTTLAKELYNHYSTQRSFGYQTFLELGKGKDVAHLQNQVLELLGKKDENVTEKYRGYFNKLVGVKALVIIDDISYAQHFTDLVPDLKKLGAGSRIILTSRDKAVLDLVFKEAPRAYFLLEMQVLNSEESLELFCFHAFLNKAIPSDKHAFYPLAKKVADMCKGLPLALEIIGKHLYNRSEGEWEEEAREMSASPNVLDTLSISYKGLSSKSDKVMFLDIACHMVGLLKEDAKDIWESCASRDSNPPCWPSRCMTSRKVKGSLQTLINKSLVKVDNDKRLTMHDLIQEMGRKMVRDELVDGKARGSGEYSHLWDPAEAEDVVNEEEGTKEVRGLSLAGLNGKTFKASAFQNMTEIHLLLLDGARIEGDFSQLSKKIRWMQWRNSFLSSLPLQLHYLNLTVLDLSNSKSLTQLWTEHDAYQVPILLKVLILQNCISLEKIPENIKFLTRLRTLDLQGCKKLTSLPGSLGELKGLVSFNLSGCEGLETLPDSVVKLPALQTFSMNGCVKIPHLPVNFGDLEALVTFSAEGASSLTALPDSFFKLSRLDRLVVSNCHSLSQLPRFVKELTHLRVLLAHDTAIRELASDFGDLKSLVQLGLTRCNQLESLPESFGDLPKLEELVLEKSLMFRKLSINFGQLQMLSYLDLEECPIEDGDVPCSFGGLEKLSHLRMQKNKMTKLPCCFKDLTGLKRLNLEGSPNLVDVESLPVLLEELELGDCPKVVGISIKELSNLRKLTLCNCTSLTKLEGVEHAESLVELNVSGCCSLSELQNDLLKSTMTYCYISGSGVRLKYNNEWNQDGAPVLQLVSYYDQAMGFVENLMTKKISSMEHANELCLETGIKGSDVAAVVITVVAHDQGWSDFTHLHGRYRAECDLEARIVRSEEGLDVEVVASRLYALRHADHKDQVYICTLRRSHPLIQRLKQGDKLCVYALSRYQKWGITVMQGHIHVAYDQDTTEDPFQNLLLTDNLSSSFRAQPFPTVRQAFTENRRIFTIKNSDGDLPVAVLARVVFQPLPVQVNGRALSSRAVMVPSTSFRICDICSDVISERGYHCNTCADFDMCQSCNEVQQSVHPSDHLLTAFETNGHNGMLPYDITTLQNWGYVVDDLWWSESFPASGDPPAARNKRIHVAERSSESNPNYNIGHIVDVPQ